ncbi:MAG: hypothetical protein WAM70_02655 [Pyrinomonadaceae bacterium]
MPGWLKALLIVAIIIALLIVGAIGAGVWWWMRNKDALRSRARAITTEGKDFGKTTDNKGCVDEALNRYKKDPGLLSAFANQGFLTACLEASRPTTGFCDNVPLGDFAKMQEWQAAQCKRYDLRSGRDCQALVMPVAMFCGDREQNQN